MSDHHTLPRAFVSAVFTAGVSIELGAEQAHYFINVLRLKPGDGIRIFNADDGEWLASIGMRGKRALEVVVIEQIRHKQAESPLLLCCAPIKKAHFDFMLMKATELGVTAIRPIITARTQAREVNAERCRAIVTEAAEQSERLSVPDILPAVSLDKFTTDFSREFLPIICAEFGESRPVRAALEGLDKTALSAAIITGPEGGFTPEEMAKLHGLPRAVPIRLGPRILRADTAAIAALSCWQAIRGDWN